MIKEDYIEYLNFFNKFSKSVFFDCENNLILSPCIEQVDLFNSYFKRPPNVFNKDNWDITKEAEFRYDIIFSANVLMYIDKPEIAIKNILKCCKWFVLQDLIIRNRGENEFGGDGDCMRFSYGSQVRANYQDSFDLMYFSEKINYFKNYNDSKGNIHFITLIKGEL